MPEPSSKRALSRPRRLLAACRLALAALLVLTAAPAAAGGRALPAVPMPSARLVASDPGQVGQWSSLMNWPLDAVHASLMPTGSVLLWDAWETGGTPSAQLWNPGTGTFAAVPNQTSQLFCSAHIAMADGRLMVVGGHNGPDTGIDAVNAFDSTSAGWSLLPSMNSARWYPAVARLGDGRVVAISGNITPSTVATTPEVYDPATNAWTALSSINTQINYDSYPEDYTLPDGRVFVLDSEGGQLRLLDASAGTWSAGPTSPVLFGSSTMYRPGKILVSGGGAGYGSGYPSQTSAETIDMTAASPAWSPTAPMAYPRYQHNLVTLPDGNVLTLGGSVTVDIEEHNGSLPAELWNPQTGQWTTVAAEQNPRMYHSTAVLLPDGRVLSAGGGRIGTATDYLTAEIYSPPYLFKGARPAIASAPATASYAATMSIQSPDAASISSVALVNLPSNTHTMNFGQTYVPLSFSVSGSTLNVQAPASANLAPPGYYMLFLVNSSGVPSVATMVQLSPGGPVISGVTAGGVTGSSANVSWTSDRPATSQVEYGTTSAYGSSTALDSSLVTSHAQTLTGLQPGTTYHFRVDSRDASGNLGRSPDATFTTPGSTIIYRSSSTVSNGLTVGAPAGMAAGDVLVANVEVDADPATVSAPAGWTQVLDTRAANGLGGFFHAQTWYHVATASEPTSYSWNVPGNPWVDIGVLDYTNVDPASPIDASAGRDAGSTTSPVTASITTGSPNEMVVAAFVNYGSVSWTAGSGMSKRYDFDSNTAQDTLEGSPGATGAVTATASGSGPTAALLLALRQRAAGVPPVISGVQATNITTTGATIGWSTDVAASSQVDYGTTSAYGSSTTLDSSLVTSHSQALSGLQPGTTYHYRVRSAGASGTLALSGDQTLTTATPPPPVISGVQASATGSGATVTWSTDTPSDSTVQYGASSAYGSSASSVGLVTAHSVVLSGLQATTTYHYRVLSRDAAGQTSSSADLTFTTASAPRTPPRFRSQSTISNGTSVNRPIGVAAGDLLLATMEVDADPVTVTGPPGWTLLLDTRAAQGTASAFHSQVWYRVATASEPASYGWTVPGGTWVDLAVLDYSGVNAASPIDVSAGAAGSGTAATTPAVTTTQAGDLVLAYFVDYNSATWSVSSGATERFDFDGNSAQDVVPAAPGSVSLSATASTAAGLTAQVIAIRGS